jgi:hypothetical protein
MALTARLDVQGAAAVQASKVIQDLTYTAVAYGTAGNSITIRYVDPAGNDQALAVSVIASAITVSLATGPAGAITSTAAQIKAAVDASSPAHALVTVAVTGTGSTVQTAASVVNLASGAASAVSAPQNQEIPMVATITNSAGAPVTLQSIRLLMDFPADTDMPKPPFAASSILAQNVTIGAGSTVYVGCSVAIFGIEVGSYVVDAEIVAPALCVRCTNKPTITLV